MFSVDNMDNAETAGIAYGRLAAEFIRTKVVPELDAFRFAEYASASGVSSATGSLASGANVVTALRDAVTKMDEDEVPEEGRILYATPTLLNGVMALDTTKSREVLATFSKTVKVPQSRFYTAIDLLDGKTSGEEAGHYRKAEAGKDINFMIVHKPAVIKFDKHTASDIIPASANPDADADISKYRKYGIVDVFKNKVAGIYLSHKA
jgi:hypothetical protein